MYLVTRTETFAKLFFLLTFSGLFMYIVLAFYTFHTAILISKSEAEEGLNHVATRFNSDFKYILLWSIPERTYNLTTGGQQIFINNNCRFINCFLTTNKDLGDQDVRNFHAIVFSINTLKNWKANMPKSRSPKQKYIFFSLTSADKLPVCNVKADGFFNWTWSYKLHSDIVTPFIEVKDLDGKVVAPKSMSNWTETIEEINDSVEIATGKSETDDKSEVVTKTKALMWYTDKCNLDVNLATFIRQLRESMNESYLVFDIYGCRYKKCPDEGCLSALKKDYFFYLAYEDSFSEDYVTTEVLKGYHHNAVPIVVGGADYVKFLPYNSYIDATHESTERLAALLHYIIRTPSAYRSYFSWKKHFTIHETNLQRGYCDICEKLNRKVETTVYKNFRKWWFYRSLSERCYPKGAEKYDDVFSYVKNARENKP